MEQALLHRAFALGNVGIRFEQGEIYADPMERKLMSSMAEACAVANEAAQNLTRPDPVDLRRLCPRHTQFHAERSRRPGASSNWMHWWSIVRAGKVTASSLHSSA